MTVKSSAVPPRGWPYVAAVCVVLAWGVLTFGAVYPWGWMSLFTGCATVGCLGLLQPRPDAASVRPLALAFAGVIGATTIQLVPVPQSVLQVLSPRTVVFASQYSPAAVAGHAIPSSIQPDATAIALGALCALGLLVFGALRRLKRRDLPRLAGCLVVVGTAVAVEGVVQYAVSPQRIYGFWSPSGENPSYFGPFVNRNHFAGWMLMVLPLGLGFVAHLGANQVAAAGRRWRHHVSWLSSKEGSLVLLAAFGVCVMALSLYLTKSRSGILALGAAAVAAIWLASRWSRSRSMTAGVALTAAALLLAGLALLGPARVTERFASAGDTPFAGRAGAWSDALQLAKNFPVTGTGLNTYGTAMLTYQSHSADKWYSAAHNDYLQLFSDGGLLVTIPVLVFFVVFVREVRAGLRADRTRHTIWLRLGALTGMTAIAVQELVDFSLQIPGNAAMFAALAIFALHRTDVPGSSRSQHIER